LETAGTQIAYLPPISKLLQLFWFSPPTPTKGRPQLLPCINHFCEVMNTVSCNDDFYSVASSAMGHWGTCPARLPTVSFL